ncbi:MAG: acyl-CoA dehydrogenase family protein [Polyangiaceae bacterium]
MAAVALGIARASIDALLELAAVKTPLGARGALRERSTVQAEVARAEAALRAARAFVFESVDAAWADALSGKTITTGQLVLVRLASTHATEGAARVVDAMYRLGGGSSIYASSPLQRRFRDIHVATQHVMVAESMYGTLGRALLGLPVDRAAL